jgi:TonB family protein
MKRFVRAALTLGLSACANDAPLVLPVAEEQETPFVYPESLWDEGVEGQAVVMVHVTAEGAVDSVYVRTTSGYEAMDSAALRGARELRFEPGRRGVEAVDVWVRLPVRFSRTPPAAGADAAAAQPRSGTGT